MLDERLNSSWWALRLAYGLVPIVAGLDKFTNLLTRWTDYLSPLATRILPVAPSTLMHVAGVVEIAAGILVLTRYTRYAAYIVAAWLLLIALNLPPGTTLTLPFATRCWQSGPLSSRASRKCERM